MIKVEKGEIPQILVENAEQWTQDYAEAIASGGTISNAIRFRYRHPQIKAALVDEASGKCIYCERKVSIGETDHIKPVSRRPDLIVAWNNLGLVCKDCNMHKSSYYDENEPLINPFEEDPGDHVKFYGPMIMSHTGDQEGFRTIETLRLQRMELFERRKERLERLQALIEQWNVLPNGATKDIAKRKILEEGYSDKEFSATVKDFLYQSLEWE